MNESKMNVKIRRGDLLKLMIACTKIEYEFRDEMKDGNVEVMEIRRQSAEMWARIHDELEGQLKEFDNKHGVE